MGHGCGYIEGESDCGMCGKSNSPSGYRAELDEFSVSLPTYRIVQLEERVAKTEFTLAEAVRTVRRLEYQLELLDDRDIP